MFSKNILEEIMTKFFQFDPCFKETGEFLSYRIIKVLLSRVEVDFQTLSLRIGPRNPLVVVNQSSRHDARLGAQQVGSQSGHLVRLNQLPHGLCGFHAR
jgi:hypothetical protein